MLARADDNKLIEVIVEKMASTTLKGLDYIDSSFTLHQFNIRDHTFAYLNPHLQTAAPFPYLLETYIPMGEKFMNVFSKKLTGQFKSPQ